MVLFMMSYDTVEMIKQFPDVDVHCMSLSFHGDVVYIGSSGFVIQWNVVTDTVVKLDGFPGLISPHFCIFGFMLRLGNVYALDVSPDGSVVVGSSLSVVIAHATATGTTLWRKEMPRNTWSLRIHGGVVVVPIDDRKTVVLDVTTGHQLHTLPSAGKDVQGICVFDGLISYVFWFDDFSHHGIILALLTKAALKVDDTIAGPGLVAAC
jgi:hypothetical protein